MTVYMAELVEGIVQRVIVAPDQDWPARHLGGEWVPTCDPYTEPGGEQYAGPGMGHDASHPVKFAPVMTVTRKLLDDGLDLDAVVYDGGKIDTVEAHAIRRKIASRAELSALRAAVLTRR